MNILNQKQVQEKQETICKIHNLELIAVDFDLSDKSQIQFFCGKCLVEKMNNNKVTTIEQSKERIQLVKAQQRDIKTKENQARLSYYKNILDQIMDFKQSINDSLEKMYKQIQQYIYPIQKEKQEIQEYEQQLNYFEDIKQLSELYSQEQQKSPKLIEDNHFINEIQRQFELLFNSSEYFQTLDTFKNTKETIKDIMENNVIELIPQLIKKNDYKTPSLSRICSNHKKEIIMIDMDSSTNKIEDRFACVDCISENPQIKYQTIENVDKQWKEYNTETERICIQYKNESKEKKSELFNQLAHMRKNYNKKLNEISDKLITEQFLSIVKTKQSNQIKKISIQALDDEQLLKDLKQLIEKEKEKVQQSQIITNLKNKDQIFKKDIQYHLESLQQYDQQDIQQSLDILKDISIEKNLIIQLIDLIQEMQTCAQKDENYKNQINFIKEIQELIDQAKKYQCQLNLFDQTITIYQQHVQKIEYIQQNIQIKTQDQTIKSEQLKSQYSKLQNILNEYSNKFDNNSVQLKKYCTIKQLENDIIKLNEAYKKLEVESNALQYQIENNFISSQEQQFEQKLNEINGKLQLKEKEQKDIIEQYQQTILDNTNVKKQYELDKMAIMKKLEDEQNKLKQEFNQNLSQKESELKEALSKLDQINKIKLEQEKQNKIELEKIQQYNKSLSFSNTYKHNNCELSECTKLVAEVANNGYFFCLCEQAIPKTGKIQFAFQILSGSYFHVGIGFRDIMQKNNYQDCYQTGTYLIRQDGYTYSHHNKDLYHKKLSFQFTNNDIIIIEVCIEHKYIKWSRQNNSQATFVQLDIDTSQELYPCVGVAHNSKIKLLDNIPV
ncbi:unnamed protein product [Paramecium pentaurelia]|uniref:Uncharacterized protein n=1 Tax=Paramecium pentaurelia TaxID=43138 RepID=A0A8S1V5N5_9CILI|nr:unnamed protein product [Paramecium pentaurelia]